MNLRDVTGVASLRAVEERRLVEVIERRGDLMAIVSGPAVDAVRAPPLDDATRVVDLTSGCVTTGGGGSLAGVQNAFRVAADVTADARGITVVIARMSVRRGVVHASRNARLETTMKTTKTTYFFQLVAETRRKSNAF